MDRRAPFSVGAVVKVIEPVPLASGGAAEAGTIGRIISVATPTSDGEPTYTVMVLRDPAGWRQSGSIPLAAHRGVELLTPGSQRSGVVVDCEVARTCWKCGQDHLLRYPVYGELGVVAPTEYDCPVCGERQEEADAFAGPLTATPK